MKYLKELGFIVLHNEHAMVQSHERPDDYFYMAGTDDIKADTIGYVAYNMPLKMISSTSLLEKSLNVMSLLH